MLRERTGRQRPAEATVAGLPEGSPSQDLDVSRGKKERRRAKVRERKMGGSRLSTQPWPGQEQGGPCLLVLAAGAAGLG